MSTISTHVLDTTLGRPAAGMRVTLSRGGAAMHSAGTDADGRITSFGGDRTLEPGSYQLRFDVAAYLGAAGRKGFYREIVIQFEVGPGEEHYHVPLLLSPYGYTTYRGS
ncbi:MAG TPA: hydroxyisourate hydrolase [Gemmatimonadales bacterium]|nr:hydroxyisourate hydrolase [Gemmatimonadales bacterium]